MCMCWRIQGADCSKPPCQTVCVNGKVNQENCACECTDGWSGPTCACSLKCANGGVLDKDKCTCTCAGGYRGADCTKPPCKTECANGKVSQATCLCECSQGWTGAKCDCNLRCSNGGTLDEDKCECGCTGGFRGADCSLPPCKTECVNGKVNQKNCACECTAGWTGSSCDCSLKCENGGALDQEKCECSCSGITAVMTIVAAAMQDGMCQRQGQPEELRM
ncbi:wnt inhibitory factor 1-like [Haliotis rubra]|uniref:wnt inhibitory factor 1-like n=1 Tax=Haliotis rubra TaxID=36100 RepID=UPI001EE520C3|nr:wnt inhibitory factor 1-like [Haliotis rubra]